ncbi:heat shock 70 kDa protein 12A-like isoform X2 [Lineus longissimus]
MVTEWDGDEKIVTTEKIVGDDGNECETRTETVVKIDSTEDKDTEKVVTKIDRTTSKIIVEVDAVNKSTSPRKDNLNDSIDREEQKREAFRYFEKLGREASLEGLKLRSTPDKSAVVKEDKIVPSKAQRPKSGVSNLFTGTRDVFTGLRKVSPSHKSQTLDAKKMNRYDVKSTGDISHPRHMEDMTYADSDPSLRVTLTGMTAGDWRYSPTGSSSTDTSLYGARSPRSPIRTNGSFNPSSVLRRPSPNSSNVSLEIHNAIDTLDSAIALSSQSSVDSGLSSDPARQHGHFVVVAIDFGTTYSGYAFSFTRDPSSVHMMRKWEGGDPGVINQKTPTTLLLSPDERFHSFGFSARDHFHDLDPQEAKKWLYFEKFKMLLHHNPELNEKTMIPASNGKEVPAVNVFAHSLMFFKEHALQELSDQSTIKILNEDVRWVITVPAIWKQPAKQFMRQAAYKAGIANPEFPDQILIALEPEAASIYCRRLRMYQLVPEAPVKRPLSPRKDNQEPMNMDFVCEELRQDLTHYAKYDISKIQGERVENIVRGTCYMVVDCGGGTVDITVHQLDESAGKLRELHKATGGPHGSVGVDQEFERLLIRIFGQDFVDQFKCKRPAGFVDLMIAFESRKRAASPFKENPLNVSLPFSFIDYYKKSKGCPVDVAVRRYNEKYNDKDVRWSSQGMLRLNPETMRRLFQPTLEKIMEAVGRVLNHPDAKGTQYVFLVGGFAESPILQHALRKEFGHIVKLIIPQDMGLTILKGAVLFGLDPTIVSLRKSRLTYGVGVLNRYNNKKHPKEKLVKRDKVEWCTDIFDKFVCVNQAIALGDTVLRSYTPAKSGQKQSVINIYCTDRENAEFITDRGVKICGTLILDLTDTQYQTLPKRREIQARMLFGDTEIKVSALDVATGRCVKAAIDFLNK